MDAQELKDNLKKHLTIKLSKHRGVAFLKYLEVTIKYDDEIVAQDKICIEH